jgi:hypothetical protein
MKTILGSKRTFRRTRLATVLPALFLIGCGAGGDSEVNSLLNNDGTGPTSEVSVRVDLPGRITNLNEALIVQGTVSGLTSELMAVNTQEYTGSYQLPFNVEHTIHLSIRRRSDNLLLGTAVQKQLTSTSGINVYFPEQYIDMSIDSDGDQFSNIQELEDGSDPFGRNGDYDGDGTPDPVDNDDDNDGVADVNDAFPYNANESVDTDLDGTGNNADPDDDNDGVDDHLDTFPRDSSEYVDTDGDGIGNNADPDDDNDGISDENDSNPLDANSGFDTDGDGISDSLDPDDDNDGVIDRDDAFPLDDSETLDTDSDGIGNNKDDDDDNDVTHDLADPAPLNPNITGREDSDSDGVPDIEDHFPLDSSEFNDQDGDGIGDNADLDDDGNGIPDNQEDAMAIIPRTNRSPTLDGVFSWREWRQAARCDNKGNYLSVGHLLRDANGDEVESRYSWYNSNWRAMHDGTYLYLLVSVRNEPFYERFNDSTDAWHDDGIEIYLDTGNERAQTYDSNDFQKVYTFAGSSATGSSSANSMRTTFATSRDFSNSDATWSYYEIRIDMSSISLPIGQRFGFDVHINDDDNGGDRDTKWAWYTPSGNDTAWQNPSLFGQAILAPDVGYYD